MPDIQAMISTMPFSQSLGITLDAAAPAEVRGRMDWTPERCTIGGALHGGALMGFADSLGAICAFLNLPAGASTTTVESKTNFFRGLRGGHATGVTKPLHVGGRFVVVQTDVFDPDGRRLAQITQTQAVLTSS